MSVPRRCGRCARNRQELLDHHALLQHRLEFVVDNKYFVDLLVFGEPLDHVARDFERFRKIDASFAGHANVFAGQRRAAPAKEVSALAADCQNLDLLARILSE